MNTDQLIDHYGLTNTLSAQQKSDLNKILGAAGKAALEVGVDYLERERQRLGLPPLTPPDSIPWGGETDAQRNARLLEEERARAKELQTILYIVGGLVLVGLGFGLFLLNKKKTS